VVTPVDPFQGGEFDLLDAAPVPAPSGTGGHAVKPKKLS